ncbi:hypothetical protein AALA17_02200 [Lactobacillaceae bacterium 24-114]
MGNGELKMRKGKNTGLNYVHSIIENKCLYTLILWLGFRPFNEDELDQLMDKFSDKEIIDGIHRLQYADIVEPMSIRDHCWNLTGGGGA